MKFPDLRVGWRLFIGKPLTSPLMLISLSLGFGLSFALLLFVWYSIQFDRDVPDADRIVLVKNKFNVEPTPVWYDRTPFTVGAVAAATRSDLIEASVAVVARPAMPMKAVRKAANEVANDVTNAPWPVDVLIVQPSFLQVFQTRVIAGDLAETLNQPDQIALTAGTTMKLFGKPDVIGQSVQIYGKIYQIGAILPDRAANTTIRYAALAGINSTLLPERLRDIFFHYWDAFGGRIYLKLKPGVTSEPVALMLQNAVDHSPLVGDLVPEIRQRLGTRKVMEIGLDRLTEIYLDDTIVNSVDSGPHSSWQTVLALASVALLILALVTANYVNFAAIQVINRHREIAIRKVVGSTTAKLVLQFWFESLIVMLLATVGGLLLTEFILPLLSELVNCQLQDVFDVSFCVLMLLLGLAVGSIAGIYPALMAIRTRPHAALSGRGSENMDGFWLRRALSVIQFSVVIVLSSSALVMARQADYASYAHQGFDPANMLVINFPDSSRTSLQNPLARSLREAISHAPGVIDVAASQAPLGRSVRGGHSEFTRQKGQSANITNRPVSSNFFDVLGVHPVAGRLFNAHDDPEVAQMPEAKSIVINLSAVHSLGYASPEQAVGELVSVDLNEEGKQSLRIIGVAPEIPQQSLHEASLPSAYWAYLNTSTLTVNYTGNASDLKATLSELIRSYFPDEIVNIGSAQSYFNENYASDTRLSRLLALSSMFSVIIAAFGIYVLSTYSVQRLAKRIAIVKLYGANYRDIAQLVGREFFMLVVIGIAFGLPIANFINAQYLSTFVDQAPLGIWPLLLPLTMVVVMTVLATAQQVRLAIKTNPARILL